jgi:hypothetical protein
MTRRQIIWRIMAAGVLAVWPQVLRATSVTDPTFSSSNYSVVESEAGASGYLDGLSSSYRLSPNIDDGGVTLGESAGGNSSSTNYQTNSGFSTSAQPTLTLVVDTAAVDLGILSTGAAHVGSATFHVMNYTSYGYVVQVIGPPPTYGARQLTALTTDTASAAGTEQFGINLRANTSPSSVGADPVQVPGSNFSYGVAGDGITGTYGTSRPYTIPNQYRYVSGEVVASSPKSTGQTDYTVSFMANIANTTPSGTYTGGMSIVATGTF